MLGKRSSRARGKFLKSYRFNIDQAGRRRVFATGICRDGSGRNAANKPLQTPCAWARSYTCNTLLLTSFLPVGATASYSETRSRYKTAAALSSLNPRREVYVKQKLPALLFAAMLTGINASAPAATGPSSSQSPYLIPQAAGVEFTSILTVGDEVKKKHKGNETYRMVGIPDGLGAYDNGDGTITVLMNHELRDIVGVPRAHGARGAFISKWQIRKKDLKVLNGEDLIKKVFVSSGVATFDRLCSADLAAPTAYFNSNTGKGLSEGLIFLNGEESGSIGRAFAHLATGPEHGTSYQLPALGNASWENLVASPYEQDKTVVAGLDDTKANASKVYIYVGHKQEEGNAVELAGLTNGIQYQVKIANYGTEGNVNGSVSIPNTLNAPFTLVTDGSGTGLNRVEDGAWDTQNPNRFYFVTTDSFNGNTRLWRLTFYNIAEPQAGGTVEILVNGDVSGQKMLDNITVDSAGDVWMQEDVGNNPHLGKIWKYSAATGVLTSIGEHDPARFIAGAWTDIDGTGSKQSDEESSGIVEVTDMFNKVEGYDTEDFRYFLLDVQAHYSSVNGVPLDAELLEGGQLLMMKAPR